MINLAYKYVNENARWIILRTTQFYSLEELSKLAKKIRNTVVGEYELVMNVGEFNEELANKLAGAGIAHVYHSLRLREGGNTRFALKDRLATLEAVKKSPLKLVFLVEPIGCEHSNAEITDAFLAAMKYNASVTGAMARVPVSGMPLCSLPALTIKRLAQIIAVIRLSAGYREPNICVHSAADIAVKWGANVVVVETSEIPRDTCCSPENEWKGFYTNTAKKLFNYNSYKVLSNRG